MSVSHDLSPAAVERYVESNLSDFSSVVADTYERSGEIFTFENEGVLVHVAHPENGADDTVEDLLVVPRALYASYLNGGNDMEAARDQLIANTTGKTVIGVTTPGFDYEGVSRASFRQILGSATGDGKSLVGAQAAGINRLAELKGWDLSEKRVGMLGYCLGATVAAKLFEPLNELTRGRGVSDLTLIESPSDQPNKLQGVDGFKNRMFSEVAKDRVDAYLEWNEKYGLVQPYDRRIDDFTQTNYEHRATTKSAERRSRLITTALFVAALQGFAGPLARYMQSNSPDTAVNVWRANNSMVTRQTTTERTMTQFADADIDAELHIIDGDDHHHPVFQSFPHVAMISAFDVASLRR